MGKHTQGPWEISKGVRGEYVAVNSISENKTVARIPWGDSDEPNAHLIAAAPDLYEALKMIDYISTDYIRESAPNVYKLVDIALAKVEGL